MEDERIETMKNWPKPKSARDIQVFLDFVNFYWRFIQGFSKIAGPLTSMLKFSSPTCLSTILQLIDMVDEDEIGESGGDGTNLSNPSASTKFTRAGYLIFAGAKRGGGNTKKSVKAAKDSDYLIPAAKKPLTTYGMHLDKRLSFNTLIQNGTSGLKSTRQAMPLVKF